MALRAAHYSDLFNDLDISEQHKQISKATLAGDVYGSNQFHAKIGQLISRATKRGAHGGDRKSEEYKNQAG